MREIKFRAWDVIRKTFDTCVSVSPGGEAYNHYDGTLYGSEKFLISQFTGLKDKNGVEIYEGDLLSNGIHQAGEVIFKDGCFMVGHFNCELWKFAGSHKEVIGNIYENPKLVEKP